MADPVQDAQYLRDCNIPALVNDMIVQILKAKPADPVACLAEWMGGGQCDRAKYGPGKGEGAAPAEGGGAAPAAPAAEKAEGGGDDDGEDDPAEDLHDLSQFKGDLEAEIKKVVAEGKTRLNLAKNRLQAVPECLASLSTVTSLSIEENQCSLESLSVIMKMPQLEYLNISDNPTFKTFPEGFGAALKNLKKIDAYKCAFTGPLNVEVCQMESLTYLNFYNNGLLKAPPEITNLKNLTELNLASNKIMAIQPGQLDGFDKLRRLALFWNKVLRLPPLTPLKALKELQLNGNQLPEMPELGVHEDLESINLSENKMTTLHPSLFQQPSLDEFAAGKNQLTNETILQGWSKLPVIRKICLPSNNLTEFPLEFLELPTLKVLELNSNQIEVIPENIDKIENKKDPLYALFLAENKIKTLPVALTNWKSAQRLALKGCPLNTADAQTKDVYTAVEAIIKSKGVDGKWIDGKRTWKVAAAPSGPTALAIGGGGDPEMKKKAKPKQESAEGGGVTLSIG